MKLRKTVFHIFEHKLVDANEIADEHNSAIGILDIIKRLVAKQIRPNIDQAARADRADDSEEYDKPSLVDKARVESSQINVHEAHIQ
ncbi:hypothetical protein PAT3040_02682 [Paenibacillus agaridevorans]|uniref:Uncharacterized protein n=1 Tax=Paenibacillus agaridevorans TaxID=171404 RepID=A0A2R5EPU3_9BACL|nr:hypothetical protein PAT3040_02682 [Paenibacillus agaridevorans]